MRGATLQMPKVQYDMIELAGGLDQLSPTLKKKPGVLTDAQNYECAVTGGYSRTGGYERFSGKAKPSAALYTVVQIEGFVNVPSLLTTLTGQSSGTTGLIIAYHQSTELGDPNYIILTQTVGSGYTALEEVRVGATSIGIVRPLDLVLTAISNAQFLNLAADVYRALIAAVPGSGSIRGVFAMNNAGVHEVFAFRDDAGATACILHKASGSGWTAVAYLNEVTFSAGGALIPADGATLTKGGVTATIKRVATQSGDWLASTAAGRFIITNPSGGNFSAGAATVTGGINVTLAGIQTAITMLPGGKFEFDVGNFGGQLATRRIYGCDKVNRGFEFDGVTLAPIKTALLTDVPTHVAVFQSHLFFGFGSSIINSGIGTPFNWTAGAGAAEIATGDQFTGFKVLPGDQSSPAMLIGCRNSFGVLYGAAAGGDNPFRYVAFNTETGMIEYSVQMLDQIYELDDRGVITLRAAQEFGNFGAAALTYVLQTYIQEKRTLLTYSCVNKDRSQHRLFFSDGSALYLTITNGRFVGAIPIKFPNAMVCAYNCELANGNEVTYAGSTNGMVYQLESGSSFDGEAVDAYMVLNWNAQKGPRTLKRYRRASLEIQANFYAAVAFEYQLGYGSTNYPRAGSRTYENTFTGTARWDSGITWDSFIWDGQTVGPIELEMSGTGENIQVRLSSATDYIFPYTLNSLILHYTPRRGLR